MVGSKTILVLVLLWSGELRDRHYEVVLNGVSSKILMLKVVV
jgi:hypothetical protein